MRLLVLFFISLFSSQCVFAFSFSNQDKKIVRQHLLNNIATSEHSFVKEDWGRVIQSKPGAVLASPSNKGPVFDQDYQFHWVRDAAITMNQVVTEYVNSHGKMKDALYDRLLNYVAFENQAQRQPSNPGEETLGQPKFNFDGTVWEGAWGRPQNDGPALRALTLVRIANEVLPAGEQHPLRGTLSQMIYTDLDYLIAHWQDKSFGLWEEVNDRDHFFNKMGQRKAFVEGARYAEHLGDHDRAAHYRVIADEITKSLSLHWNASRGYLSETVYQQDYKGGGLNSSIILGALYGNLQDSEDPYAITSDAVESSVFYLRNAFAALYPLNVNHPELAPLIGRYPNDMYDGDKFLYGNPWVLLTNALAQYYYECALEYSKLGVIHVNTINLSFFSQLNANLRVSIGVISHRKDSEHFDAVIKALISEGDRLLARVRSLDECQGGVCLHFAEQIDRMSGRQVSAQDLTWSYGSLLGALAARSQAMTIDSH